MLLSPAACKLADRQRRLVPELERMADLAAIFTEVAGFNRRYRHILFNVQGDTVLSFCAINCHETDGNVALPDERRPDVNGNC